MYKTILIVEPDEQNRKNICDCLNTLYKLEEVCSSSEAVTYLMRHYKTVKLVLASIHIFKQDNYNMLSFMQRNTALGQIPVICIDNAVKNTSDKIALEKEALSHGAIDFFAPPFDIDIMHHRISNLIFLHDNAALVSLSHTTNAIKDYDATEKNGTFWNPNSLDTLIMRTYVGAACIFETTKKGVSILRANEKFSTELLGSDADTTDIKDISLTKHMDEQNLDIFSQALDKTDMDKTEVSCALMLHSLRKDQPVMHVHFAMKLIDHVRTRRLYYCTLENDTEQFETLRRERALMAQLQIIIQNVSGGVTASFIIGDQINYIYTNDEFYSMFGYTKEQFETELQGSIYDLILPEYLPKLKEQLSLAALNMQTLQLEYRVKKRDGSIIWIRSRNSVCHLNLIDEPVYITIYMDISSEKKTEERVTTINNRLGNSDVFIQLDITNKMLEEYHSKLEPYETVTRSDTEKKDYERLLLSQIYEKDRDSAMQILSYAALQKHYNAGDTKLSIEYRRYMPDNEIRWFCATAIFMEGMISGTINALIYSHDINDRMKKRIARKKIVNNDIDTITIIHIADGIARAIKTTDRSIVAQGDFYHYNEKLQYFIDSEVAIEDKERSCNFFPLEKLLNTMNEPGNSDFSFWLLTPDGKRQRKSVHVSYLDSTHDDLLMVGRDITSLFQKEQEQQLALQNAANMANDANKAKSDFLSRMSHDMRTPLNAILGLTELAKKVNTNSEIADYIKSIDISGQYLLGLINDTLDLCKIESGKIELNEKPYPIDEFILGLNTVIRPLMDAKGITFILNLDHKAKNIIVDKLRFTQIFYNLLSNAAKYTPVGGKVEFSTKKIADKDGKFGMRFIVKDNGIGMSKQYLKILFDPFTQENRPELSERKGSGLGLAIVKKIVDATGGNIHVKSTIGKGTEFLVDLYAYNVTNPGPGQAVTTNDFSDLKGKRILIVDDSEMNVMIFKKILEYQGCLIETAYNGLEALNAFLASTPNYFQLILTDIHMPVMNGLEEARKIRALDRPDAKQIPIIAVTADAYTDTLETALASGVNTQLIKPIQTDLLCETILELLHTASFATTKV